MKQKNTYSSFKIYVTVATKTLPYIKTTFKKYFIFHQQGVYEQYLLN